MRGGSYQRSVAIGWSGRGCSGRYWRFEVGEIDSLAGASSLYCAVLVTSSRSRVVGREEGVAERVSVSKRGS